MIFKTTAERVCEIKRGHGIEERRVGLWNLSGAYIGKVGAGFCGVWAGLVAFRRNLYRLGAFFHHFSTFLGAFGIILRRFWPKTAIAACFGRPPLSQHTLFSVKRSLKAFFVLPGHKFASRKHRVV